MAITLTIDQKGLARFSRFGQQVQKQLPFAIAQAMTASAKKAQAALKAQTPRYIDRPTRWTLNSTYVKFATKRNLQASVGFKDFASKGTPAGKYLNYLSSGGPRRSKSTERQLQRSGLLRPGQFIVPTNVTPLNLNQYGNLSGGAYTQVLSRLKALGQQGYTANVSQSRRSQAKRTQRDYFLGRPGNLPLGIQARVGPKPKGTGGKGSARGGRPVTANLPRGFHTVFYVTRTPVYRATFPIQKIIQGTFINTFNGNLQSSLERALANAR